MLYSSETYRLKRNRASTFSRTLIFLTCGGLLTACGSLRLSDSPAETDKIAQQTLVKDHLMSDTLPERPRSDMTDVEVIDAEGEEYIVQSNHKEMVESNIPEVPVEKNVVKNVVNNDPKEGVVADSVLKKGIIADKAVEKKLQVVKTVVGNTAEENTAAENSVVKKTAAKGQPKENLVEEKVENGFTVISIAQINRMTEEMPTAAGIPSHLASANQNGQDRVDVVLERDIAETKHVLRQSLASMSYKKVSKPEGKAQRIHWALDRTVTNGACRLVSPTVQMASPGYTSQVWMNVEDGHLKVNSTTNIDISLPGVGIVTDQGRLYSFTKQRYDSNVEWSGDVSELMQQTRNLEVVLGGNELGRQHHKALISLDSLKQAYSQYRQCRQSSVVARKP